MAENSNATDGAAVPTNPEEGDINSITAPTIHHRSELDETADETNAAAANNNNNNNDNDNDDCVRIGTISSARFNILSTMVGGGCLSLPLAFQESGNALVGPLVLLATGIVTEFCFKSLVASAFRVRKPHPTTPGTHTFESIASEAFGPNARRVSMGLVVLMCFFGTVGYSVLLRDMMEPLNDAIAPPGDRSASASAASAWLHRNFTMFLVVFLVTPFCTLRRLTALKDCGAASMLSLLVLGTCIVVRSVQCNAGRLAGQETALGDHDPWYTHLRLFPESWRDLLDALPLYISCFVCHYNILPVHNELRDPSPARVSWWLRSTTWFAVVLYTVMGFAGSAYAHCTPTGKVQGNILLDFDENDPLLMVGRMCLAVTITLAFPMLVIPGRDIVVRSLVLPRLASTAASTAASTSTATANSVATGSADDDLREPLLAEPGEEDETNGAERSGSGDLSSVSFAVLLSVSIVIFWSASALASLVSSIDVVWDLLGSSLSILMSYLIPAGSYLVITGRQTTTTAATEEQAPPTNGHKASRLACWLLLLVSVPLMVVSTVNAVHNTFF